MFKIEDNTLIINDSYFTVDRPNTRLEVVGKLPIASIVDCEITGSGFSYRFPLPFVKTIEEGNVFGNIVLLDFKTINSIRNDSEQKFKFKILVNNNTIQNECPIRFNPKLKENFSSHHTMILKEIAAIKQRLIPLKSKDEIKLPEGLIAKGMVPIATGNGSEYQWDYLFDDVSRRVKEMLSVLIELTELNESLTDRLTNIEKKLTEHIYEDYEI